MKFSSSIKLAALFAMLLSLTFSCSGNEGEVQDLAGRLAAAEGISSVIERDKALAAVALDAGHAANGEVAQQAVAAISSQIARDQSAAETAKALADIGQYSAATKLAENISSVIERDKMLAAIAKSGS